MRYAHIAGTNGKGSVAEFICHIMSAAGQRCGCYTSPHLISVTERMRIDGECISGSELEQLLEEVKKKGLAVNDTLFAAYTAAAVLWFAHNNVDCAVMETGLGGRLDPTNLIQPSVTVLTPIDYDHMDVLGKSLENIANEKCGIIKPGVPVVSSKQHESVKNIIISHCEKKHSSLEFADGVKVLSSTLAGQKICFDGMDYFIRTIGEIQPENAAVAMLVAKKLGADEQSIRTGLKNTVLKCRTEYFKGDPDMMIDGAHNLAAVDMLLGTLKKHFSNRKKVLLFACMKDKDYKGMINRLSPYFKNVVVTQVDSDRCADTKELAAYFSEFLHCEIKDDTVQAFQAAKKRAQDTHAMLVAAGSFYLAGAVSRFVTRNKQNS
ncbi:MAG: bifunctional folylpolyglutamate synthase/dihydrofolate synthase [Eubacteriales bacterium]|nr:bifunctional folylpolyglutamate synthase/dihydrofolate synthase [Eubacteriales bacterium]